MRFKKILVVNRLSQYTRDAVRYGVTLATRFQADLLVLRVISNPVDQEAVNAPSLFIKGEKYKTIGSIEEQPREELERTIREEVPTTLPVTGLVTDRDPLPEITRIVREEKIDLLVVLAHEQSRLENLLFPENDGLIRTLPCSILLMKHEPRPAG
ncbi:universal stress protein [Geomonas sp. Red69]|uniref:Universal stress protein n=1 Tax=Geomonas diazotrophica TaxID=2843197 RepID=A0ABX8JFC7_9BACT|nr:MULTISPECIES: universal stress protein [Geomonas]MBU5636858.1 universal stress protein [Geomonas diazotrophica]QWV96448.1 universal stress protein [Geomonas nitrogeniifigens]